VAAAGWPAFLIRGSAADRPVDDRHRDRWRLLVVGTWLESARRAWRSPRILPRSPDARSPGPRGPDAGLSGRPSGRCRCRGLHFTRWDAINEAAADSLCDVKLAARENPRPGGSDHEGGYPWSRRLKNLQHVLCAIRRPRRDGPPVGFAECLRERIHRSFQPGAATWTLVGERRPDGCSVGRPLTGRRVSALDMDADRAGWGASPSAILVTVSPQHVMYGTGEGDVRHCGAGARTG
jgi:hypothetical protein